MLKISEQVLPILVVPSSPHSLVFRPSIDLLVLFDSRGYKPPYERKVLRRVLSSHLAVIFLECHACGPMEPIFDLPMLTRGLKELFGVGLQAGDEVAAFGFSLSVDGPYFHLRLADKPLRFHEGHAPKAWPSLFVDQALSCNIDRPAATSFHSPVSSVYVGVARLEIPIQPALEEPLNVGP